MLIADDIVLIRESIEVEKMVYLNSRRDWEVRMFSVRCTERLRVQREYDELND